MRRPVLLSALLALALLPAPAHAIVGGSAAATGEWPWQVQLAVGPYLCGGSLVAPDRVVTAAHCTDGLNAEDITVFSGAPAAWGGAQTAVADVAEHPAKSVSDPEEPPRSDLTVLRLEEPAPGGVPIGVVDAAAETALWNDPADELWVTGWGLTAADGDVAGVLQEVAVPRVSDATCSGAWGPSFSPSDMVCAGEPGHDSCNGDSGGPLVARAGAAPAAQDDAAAWRLVGVVSWGAGDCAGPLPGVYARLGASSLNAFAQPDASVTFKPRATAPPQLGGTVAVGETLTCGAATWAEEPATRRHRFFRFADADDDEPELAGAGSEYVVRPGDAGRLLACAELAENEGGLGYALSALSAPVPAAPPVVTTTTPKPEVVAPTPAPPPPAAPVPVLAPPAPVAEPVRPTAAPDTRAPRSTYAGRSCRARRCTIAIRASDDSVLPLALRATLVRFVRQRCRRGGKPARCVRARSVRVTVERLAGSLFEVTTPRLARGRYRLEAWASDSARNEQARPTALAFRL